MIILRRLAMTAVVASTLLTTALADVKSQAEASFKVVQNMLTLCQTEYIEETPATKIVSSALTNLKKTMAEKGLAVEFSAIPADLTDEQAENFLRSEFVKAAQKNPSSLDDNWLAHRAIEGMVEGLGDRYTVFMEPEEYRSLRESMSGGNFGGVGIYIELAKEPGSRLTVSRPIPDTPAADAGIIRS